mmetsp:Transcript_32006/g.70805  ORF Transcript_32006/g.70805 Transcript_32006/m.70805 type:complete len:271 (+) Transcript_32006:85-897(+)
MRPASVAATSSSFGRPVWPSKAHITQLPRATSAPAWGRAGREEPPPPPRKLKDWARGWAAHPVQEGGPRWSIPISGAGNGPTRATYLHECAQNRMHIPGPGAYRSYEDFADPNLGRPSPRRSPRRRSPRKFRKQGVSRPWSAPVQPSSEGVGGAYTRGPSGKDGLQVKATTVVSRRPFSASFPRKLTVQECNADVQRGDGSLFKNAVLMSNEETAAWAQWHIPRWNEAPVFKYFATNKVDNPGGQCRPSKFGSLPPPREAIPVTVPIATR